MIARVIGWWTLQRRGWLYRVTAAAGGVAAAYGQLSGQELALWLGLVATVLGTGVAAANTPTGPDVKLTHPAGTLQVAIDVSSDPERVGYAVAEAVRRHKLQARPRR